LTFNVETIDTDGYHNNSTNTDRITIPSGKGGKYLIGYAVTWDQNSNGVRYATINKNGSIVSENMGSAPSPAGRMTVVRTLILDLVATDYITLSVLQNRGGTLDVVGNQQRNDGTSFFAYLIGA
jgi:hypothetical protein